MCRNDKCEEVFYVYSKTTYHQRSTITFFTTVEHITKLELNGICIIQFPLINDFYVANVLLTELINIYHLCSTTILEWTLQTMPLLISQMRQKKVSYLFVFGDMKRKNIKTNLINIISCLRGFS